MFDCASTRVEATALLGGAETYRLRSSSWAGAGLAQSHLSTSSDPPSPQLHTVLLSDKISASSGGRGCLLLLVPPSANAV